MLPSIDICALTCIIGGLVVIVNIFVQILKPITKEKLPPNILVVIVSLIVTLSAGAIYAGMNSIQIVWHMVVAAIIVSMMVAYAAMFGFDKLQEALSVLKKVTKPSE